MAKVDKLLDQAKTYFESDETIIAVVQGTYEVKILGSDSVRTGVFIATDRRLLFYAKKLGGYELESFPYENISSFEQSKNMMGSSFSFFASGNRVSMKWINNSDEFAKFVNVTKERIGRRRAPTDPATNISPAPVSQPQVDVIEQLRQLGELRKAGVLTDDEFDTKKAELLSRM